MSTLFDTGAETEAPPELATPQQVRLLEAYSYRKEAVRRWTRERAEATLRACQREERIALRRAAAQAGEIDGTRPPVPQLVRDITAAYVEQAMREPADELVQALAHSLHALTDDEAREVAGELLGRLKGGRK